MTDVDEDTTRRYLLGEMAEADKLSYEERMMTDDGLFQLLLIVEDELLDERVAGELSAGDQARFDAYFLAAPSRRARLAMAYALRRFVAQYPSHTRQPGLEV